MSKEIIGLNGINQGDAFTMVHCDGYVAHEKVLKLYEIGSENWYIMAQSLCSYKMTDVLPQLNYTPPIWKESCGIHYRQWNITWSQ